MSKENKFASITSGVLSTLGVIVLLVMTLHIVANAVLRWVADAPIEGTTEIVRFWYMPVLALVGAVAAQLTRSHTEARVLFERFSDPVRRELHVVGQLLAVGMCGLLAWYGWGEALHARELGLTGGVTGLTIWPVTFLVPICFAALTAMFAFSAVEGWRTGPPETTVADGEHGDEFVRLED